MTHDLDVTEMTFTGLLGHKNWGRTSDVHFAPDTCSSVGRPADFVASISLSYLGDMQLQLLEPVCGPNIYSDFLQDNGPGLHRFCIEVDCANSPPAPWLQPPITALPLSSRAERSDEEERRQ